MTKKSGEPQGEIENEQEGKSLVTGKISPSQAYQDRHHRSTPCSSSNRSVQRSCQFRIMGHHNHRHLFRVHQLKEQIRHLPPVVTSRLPVGSSARSTTGSTTRALARATR
jgi:hypothetical protein